ncbi:hypothetical protein C8Q74DRAFT_1373202 [Fomes fomentarius]|nr:hypothetical protein C8Q74DRAFT_1373202 [Fomes fomentarius]
MGQNWDLLNIDRKEQSPVAGCKLGECFFDDFWSLRDALTLRALPREVNTWLERGPRALQPGPLGKLSPELLDMVFRDVIRTNYIAALWFATTCKSVLEVAKPHLLRKLEAIYAPWAGGRLIYLGQYTESDAALPEGLLTDAELQQIATAEIPQLDYIEPGKMTLSLYAVEIYEDRHTITHENKWYGAQHDHGTALLELRKACKGCPRRLLELEMLETLHAFNSAPPRFREGGVPVLCNLSKAEYVREDRLSEMKWWVDVKANWEAQLGLVHALLSRICWSTDDSISMVCGKECKERLVKGPWAGDRFCIATLETMPNPRVAKKWVDVTAEADELLVHIWEGNCRQVDD